MRALETIGGFLLGIVSVLILVVGSLFAVGSIGRYLKTKNM